MKYYILIPILLLVGCASQKRCAKKFPPVITEVTTTVTEVRYRDTTIFIKGDSITLTDSIPCDIVYTKTDSTKKTKATVTINRGKLSVVCETKDLEVKLDNAIKETEVKTEIIKENRTQILQLERKLSSTISNLNAAKRQRGMLLLVLVSVLALLFFRKKLGL
jgi:hypothetical protein